MFVVGNSASKMANRAVNLEMCVQVGVTGPDVIVEKPSGKNVMIGAYDSADRAEAVFLELMKVYIGKAAAGELNGESGPPRMFLMPED